MRLAVLDCLLPLLAQTRQRAVAQPWRHNPRPPLGHQIFWNCVRGDKNGQVGDVVGAATIVRQFFELEIKAGILKKFVGFGFSKLDIFGYADHVLRDRCLMKTVGRVIGVARDMPTALLKITVTAAIDAKRARVALGFNPHIVEGRNCIIEHVKNFVVGRLPTYVGDQLLQVAGYDKPVGLQQKRSDGCHPLTDKLVFVIAPQVLVVCRQHGREIVEQRFALEVR